MNTGAPAPDRRCRSACCPRIGSPSPWPARISSVGYSRTRPHPALNIRVPCRRTSSSWGRSPTTTCTLPTTAAATCSAALRRTSRSRPVSTHRCASWESSVTTSARSDVITRVDSVTVNEAEARQFLVPHNVLKAAREILALGPRAVIIKRAEYGALLLTADRIFWTPAYPLDEVRDPTGAGDAFAGGLLGHLAQAGKLDDRTLCRAVLHGTVCASFAVEQFSVDGIEQADQTGVEARVRELQTLVSA